jgi:hypothetical protein
MTRRACDEPAPACRPRAVLVVASRATEASGAITLDRFLAEVAREGRAQEEAR